MIDIQKPIIRWTISNCDTEGLDSLVLSVKLMQKLYLNFFDYYVCYNNLKNDHLNVISNLEVKLIDQNLFVGSLNVSPNFSAWKLYPPRLNINVHEIFIDNDLIIYSKFDDLTDFITNKDLFICSAAYKRFYGGFDKFVINDYGCHLNTGFFGIPPKFDLASKINKLCELTSSIWETHYDEEGIIAAIFQYHKHRIIPMNTLAVCNPMLDFCPYKIGKAGTHFTGLNFGDKKYWNRFLKTHKNILE